MSNTPGECRDPRPPVLESTTKHELEGFPRGGWTKLTRDFPKNFSQKSIEDFSVGLSAKKHHQAGYRMYKSSKVNQVLLSPNDSFVFCKAHVEASFSITRKYPVQAKLSLNGDIVSAYCRCPAGVAGTCKHVSALMWYLLDMHLSGQKYIAEAPSCTDKQRQWGTGGKTSNASTTKFDDLVFVKHAPGKTCAPPKRKNMTTEFPLTHDILVSLHNSLSSSGLFPMFCKTINDSNLQPLVLQPLDIVPTASTALPANVQRLPLKILWYAEVQNVANIDYRLLPCDLSLNEAHALEERTRTQSSSELWHTERSSRITSSKFKHIVGRQADVTQEFLNTIFNKKGGYQSSYMKTGLANETLAAEKYVNSKGSTAIAIFDCGFCVNPGIPFLGASPDKVVHDRSTNEIGLLEVKTLSKAMELGLSVSEAIDENKATFLSKKSGKLIRSHAYFHQIQGQLAITGLNWCDLCVDSGKDIYIERVPFDQKFWLTVMMPKLVMFYKSYVLDTSTST